jgi:hypothetical protein
MGIVKTIRHAEDKSVLDTEGIPRARARKPTLHTHLSLAALLTFISYGLLHIKPPLAFTSLLLRLYPAHLESCSKHTT